MGNKIAGALSMVAGAFSGSTKKLSPGNIWAEVKCPSELN